MADAPKEEAKRTARTVLWRLVAIILVIACYVVVKTRREAPLGRDIPMEKTYEGDSSGLEHTVIVPTLDTPMPNGKNVIWCASFQLAWNRLKNDVIKAPIQIASAEAVANRLNRAKQSEADLSPGSYYATAGFVKDGIVETIEREMAERFPSVPLPKLDTPGAVIVAYAYLTARVRFEIPYFEFRHKFAFADSAGRESLVASFGVRYEDDYAYKKLRQQVEVLYSSGRYEIDLPDNEFAIDPCKRSRPNQIVLARIAPKETLTDTLADLEKKMAGTGFSKKFGVREVLLVPNMCWEVTHHFQELEGGDKRLKNRGFEAYYVGKAHQRIRFRLDRSGTELASQAKVLVLPAARIFLFDHPFLIYVKKRGAKHPFFVMWVDNAELLTKRADADYPPDDDPFEGSAEWRRVKPTEDGPPTETLPPPPEGEDP